jgi:hypothetical protein
VNIAIGICFQIVDVFRSDVLAAVMQQLLDSAVLPTLFLRTVRSPTFPLDWGLYAISAYGASRSSKP